ncbi:hypothetical protein P280DRAFT_518977 [Massarina eburnea CBS 473.64]|uniref:F-box domain-containing protein n=1 Tax=Massarina eburnea CBS 473.64 TaxID=1395130 RepID=A0A6A6RWP4_9PLEO|nr:hypothetical protein P280DRAFT_518977 [Massarina eburnea CBS 473.64]
MDTLPQELVDEIFEHLVEHEHPITERFSTITKSSKQTIFAARRVCRGFRDSKTLKNHFITLLEQTPLTRFGWGFPVLEAISLSSYAPLLRMLSISGVTYRPKPMDGRLWNMDFQNYLQKLLEAFTSVQHLRFYPVTPVTLQPQTCPNPAIFPRDIPPIYLDFSRGPGHEIYVTKGDPESGDHGVLKFVILAFKHAGIELETLETPLFGNRACYCAVDPLPVLSVQSLRRLKFNVSEDTHTHNHLPWIFTLRNLEVLEIALSHGPGVEFGNTQQLLIDKETRTMPRMKDFRLIGDNWHMFNESDILDTLSVFPNLENLGLAYIMLHHGVWWSLLRQIKPRQLKRLWLLDPGYASVAGDQVLMLKYNGDGKAIQRDWDLSTMAQDVRLIHTDAVYEPFGIHRPRYDFQYPGFEVFEEGGVERLGQWWDDGYNRWSNGVS